MYIHNMLLRIYYLEFSNLSPLLFSRYVLLLITIHAITWNARVSRSRRDANKVSISSTTVTSCFLTSDCSWLRSNGAVTKWIRGWSKWDTWVSVSTRKADFRSLYTALSCVKETPSPPLGSIPRYICIPFFFCTTLPRVSRQRSLARPFPHVGLFAMTSDSVRRVRRNIIVTFTQIAVRYSKLIRTLTLFLSAPTLWIRMNINRRELDHSLIFAH